MNEGTQKVKSWAQLQMIPPDALSIRVKVSADPTDILHHVGIEWKDLSSGELMGMHVRPGRSRQQVQEDVDVIIGMIRELMEMVLPPF